MRWKEGDDHRESESVQEWDSGLQGYDCLLGAGGRSRGLDRRKRASTSRTMAAIERRCKH